MRRLQIVNTKRNSLICELNFPTTILAVRLNRRRLVVVLEEQIYVYDISNLRLLHTIETSPNPNGALAFMLSRVSDQMDRTHSNMLSRSIIREQLPRLSFTSTVYRYTLLRRSSGRESTCSRIDGRRRPPLRRHLPQCDQRHPSAQSPPLRPRLQRPRQPSRHFFRQGHRHSRLQLSRRRQSGRISSWHISLSHFLARLQRRINAALRFFGQRYRSHLQIDTRWERAEAKWPVEESFGL